MKKLVELSPKQNKRVQRISSKSTRYDRFAGIAEVIPGCKIID